MNRGKKPDPETLAAWSDDPANWRMGVFYYNPKDKRLFPSKRYSFGWTVNFANPFSLMALVAVIAACCLVARYLGRL